jgi:hypothetical protein
VITLKELILEVYSQFSAKQYTLSERSRLTHNFILNEIDKWGIKTYPTNSNSYIFYPKDFVKPLSNSPLIQVSLTKTIDGWELKFGDLNNPKDPYKWIDNDPNRLQKALFVKDVLENKIIPIILDNKIDKFFYPIENEDNKEQRRKSFFDNMLQKIEQTTPYKIIQEKIDNLYWVTIDYKNK